MCVCKRVKSGCTLPHLGTNITLFGLQKRPISTFTKIDSKQQNATMRDIRTKNYSNSPYSLRPEKQHGNDKTHRRGDIEPVQRQTAKHKHVNQALKVHQQGGQWGSKSRTQKGPAFPTGLQSQVRAEQGLDSGGVKEGNMLPTLKFLEAKSRCPDRKLQINQEFPSSNPTSDKPVALGKPPPPSLSYNVLLATLMAQSFVVFVPVCVLG